MSANTVRERVAEAEHVQWATWAQSLLDTEPDIRPDRVERWKRLIATPYADLTEDEKDADRYWADRILAITEEKGEPDIPTYEDELLAAHAALAATEPAPTEGEALMEEWTHVCPTCNHFHADKNFAIEGESVEGATAVRSDISDLTRNESAGSPDVEALREALMDQIRNSCYQKVGRSDMVARIEKRGDLMEYACPKAVEALRALATSRDLG